MTSPKRVINTNEYRIIREFSPARRNAIRGALLQLGEEGPTPRILSTIRNNSSNTDMIAAAELIDGPAGVLDYKVNNATQKDLWTVRGFDPKSLELEIAYACGIMNAWPTQTRKAIDTIRLLSMSVLVDIDDASQAAYAVAEEWGASRYLSFKIAFLKERMRVRGAKSSTIGKIDRLVKHEESPGPQFSALECISSELPLFAVAKRHINTMTKNKLRNFRQHPYLHHLVATPYNREDAAAYLIENAGSCLIDLINASWVLMALADRIEGLQEHYEACLRTDLSEHFADARTDVSKLEDEMAEKLLSIAQENDSLEDTSLQLYRLSAACLEFPNLATFRNDLDRVIGLRLVTKLNANVVNWPGPNLLTPAQLFRRDGQFTPRSHLSEEGDIDPFYRTYLFLRYIQNPLNLSYLKDHEIKYLFNNTRELDRLLLQRELETMHLNASDETKPTLELLALALYRNRSSEPDIDFEYRESLQDYVIDRHQGSITELIVSLLQSYPRIADYMASTLTDASLQKMYSIIKNADAASNVRYEILFEMGHRMNRVEYVIEAEAIRTRANVAKLRTYFDSSRMFVDPILMIEWIQQNPSAYMQQFRELLPKLNTKITTVGRYTDTTTGEKRAFAIVDIESTKDVLISEIVKEAFSTFCLNEEFGIESYLGRRIRHNTLQGVMSEPVDAVLDKDDYHPVIMNTKFGDTLATWRDFYARYIERVRREYLQFRRTENSKGLFSAELDLTDNRVNDGLNALYRSLSVTGIEMLPELIISFCWQQIAPQLDFAQRRIRIGLALEVKRQLEEDLEPFTGPEELKVKEELNTAIDQVFSKVASWFRVPETGFVDASFSEIAKIVGLEASISDQRLLVEYEGPVTKIHGISVHRLYDCLAVLVQNAAMHGNVGAPIRVHAQTKVLDQVGLVSIRVSVTSHLDPDRRALDVSRVAEALGANERAADMTMEGYSGLKKLKYLTRLNTGASTVVQTQGIGTLTIAFTLKVEPSREDPDEDTSD